MIVTYWRRPSRLPRFASTNTPPLHLITTLSTRITHLQVEAGLKSAKAALKKAKRKDYYKILEVDKSAADEEIKKAYRKVGILGCGHVMGLHQHHQHPPPLQHHTPCWPSPSLCGCVDRGSCSN